MDEIGWEVAKAGKEFITLKRKVSDVEIEPGEVEVNSAIEYHESKTANHPVEEAKKGFWEKVKSM